MSRSDPYFTSVTPVTHRLYVLTDTGEIRRVTHMGIRPTGTPVPVVNGDGGFRYANNTVHLGTWLACHIARLRGAHRPKPAPVEPEHVDGARGHRPAATVPLPSVIPNHRRRPKPKTNATGRKDNL